MIKRAQGRKKFGRKNFKRRHFVLTNQSLSYHTKAGGKVLFEMPINDILAVEKLEEESFKMKYMFQVVQAERALYIQASHCVEEKEWIDILTKICKSNANRRKMYHPAAFVNGHWLCCKSTDHSLVGCKPVSGYFPASELQLDIDSDREVEKIHSMFLDKIDKLDDIKEMCGAQAVYAGGIENMDSNLRAKGSGFRAMCSDPASCFITISEIQKAIITLEHEHIQYMRSVHKNAVIGSLDTPIGDGSNADLLRNLNRSSERLSRHGSRSSNASNMSRRSNRISHSRGNSFRDRSRSGTESDRVKKSLSGDVSASTRSLAVDFKLDRRKAASYDTFASVERRRSHGTVEFSRGCGRFAVDSSGHLLSYGAAVGDHGSDSRRYSNNVSRDSVLECECPAEMDDSRVGGCDENGDDNRLVGRTSAAGTRNNGHTCDGVSGDSKDGGGGHGAASVLSSDLTSSSNHRYRSSSSPHGKHACQISPSSSSSAVGVKEKGDSDGSGGSVLQYKGNDVFVFNRQSSGVDTVSSSASAASTRFSGSSWMETCIDDDFDDVNDDNHLTFSTLDNVRSSRALSPSHINLDCGAAAGVVAGSVTNGSSGGGSNGTANHCSNSIIITSPTTTENIISKKSPFFIHNANNDNNAKRAGNGEDEDDLFSCPTLELRPSSSDQNSQRIESDLCQQSDSVINKSSSSNGGVSSPSSPTSDSSKMDENGRREGLTSNSVGNKRLEDLNVLTQGTKDSTHSSSSFNNGGYSLTGNGGTEMAKVVGENVNTLTLTFESSSEHKEQEDCDAANQISSRYSDNRMDNPGNSDVVLQATDLAQRTRPLSKDLMDESGNVISTQEDLCSGRMLHCGAVGSTQADDGVSVSVTGTRDKHGFNSNTQTNTHSINQWKVNENGGAAYIGGSGSNGAGGGGGDGARITDTATTPCSSSDVCINNKTCGPPSSSPPSSSSLLSSSPLPYGVVVQSSSSTLLPLLSSSSSLLSSSSHHPEHTVDTRNTDDYSSESSIDVDISNGDEEFEIML